MALSTFTRRALVRCLVLLSVAPTAHRAVAAEAPRAAVEQVAATIAARYFDPVRGEQIADALRREARAGAFDDAQGADALAAALTARLRPLDGHFRVRPATSAGAKASARPRMPPPADDGGIRKAEVLPGDVGHLALREFAHIEFDRADDPARKAIDGALARLAHTGAMVVDLRGCGGGSPAMVGYLISAFTPPEAALYNRFRTREATFDEAPQQRHPAPRPTVPLYVLIDGGTASAAESFAYTLSAAGRATLVGERSAGAANPGEFFPAGDAFEVFVPTGSPVNPLTGSNWEGTGIAPDVAVPSPQALDAAARLARERAGAAS